MLPAAFLSRMERLLGDEYADFLRAYDRPLQKGLRLGRKAEGHSLSLPFGLRPVPWAENGFTYDPETRPGKHPYHEAGVYYLQEPSAMAPAAMLGARPGERVLDLCAAPGGKSTQIASAMGDTGLLVANEIHPKRAKILSRNIERMGIANALVLNMHPRDLERRFPEFFDRIMVDAPCSGEGMFRKEEAAVTDWSEETVAMCAARQKEILRSAAAMLRPGGVLCYSTCTFAPAEDEGMMVWMLSEFPEFSPVEIEVPWFDPARPEWAEPADERVRAGFRLWPHKLDGEGHFLMLLRKAGDGGGNPPDPTKGLPTPRELDGFLKELEITLPEGRLIQFGQSVCLVPPDCPDLRGLKVLRPGLELGTIKKGRFEPAHALALWLRSCGRTLDLPSDSDAALRYLHGEVIPGEENGWTLITVDGISLGWAKGSGGQMKNHFTKGIRWV